MPAGSHETTATVGVVVPAYKEADNIGNLVREILKYAPEARVVVVDDSPDLATKEAVEGLGLPNVTVTHREKKGGRGSAVIEGIRQLVAKGCTQVVEMDADFSHPPSQIPELLREAPARGLDMLIGSRYLPHSEIVNWPLSRRIFSKCSNLLARVVLGVPIADYTNGYRVYSLPAAKLVAETCGQKGKGFISLSEILVNLHYRGFRVGEVPTIFVNRLRGESSVNFQEIKNALTGLFDIYFLKRRLSRRRPA
jgi:dolichol-phosphate mannosyltransferase